MELSDLFNVKAVVKKTEELEKWDMDNPDVDYENKPKFYIDFIQSRTVFTWTFLLWAILGLFTKYYMDFIFFFVMTLLVYPKVSSALHGRPFRLIFSAVNSLFVIGFIMYEIIKHYH
jgi:hypothetical protein